MKFTKTLEPRNLQIVGLEFTRIHYIEFLKFSWDLNSRNSSTKNSGNALELLKLPKLLEIISPGPNLVAIELQGLWQILLVVSTSCLHSRIIIVSVVLGILITFVCALEIPLTITGGNHIVFIKKFQDSANRVGEVLVDVVQYLISVGFELTQFGESDQILEVIRHRRKLQHLSVYFFKVAELSFVDFSQFIAVLLYGFHVDFLAGFFFPGNHDAFTVLEIVHF